jgi:hypothetical protein
MPITFESDNDVIVYALEKIISYARRSQQIFIAQCEWWLASVIGLEQRLISHIDTLQRWQDLTSPTKAPEERQEVPEQDLSHQQVHPDRVAQVSSGRSVSAVPRDLTEDRRLDRILESPD